MAITFQAGKIIAEFTSSGVSGDSAIGFYRLRFSLRYDTPPWPDRQFQFRNAKAEVYVVGSDINQKFLGLADPERPLIITAKPHASRSFILFNLHLSGKQLVAIEDVRRGGDLRFNLIIFGEAHADADSQAVQDELSIPVNQKAWIDVLKQMNYTDFILFEIPMPDKGAPADLKASVDLLSKAKEHYIFGNYVDTVATCRLALESLTKGLNEDDEQSEAVSLYRENFL
jgi:hypothetical protein